MTLPAPREAEQTGGGAMLNYIASSVRDLGASVDRGFEGIRRELAELPRHYVPRLEIDRRFDEQRLDVAELGRRFEAAETQRAQEARDRAEAEREAIRQARVDRWQRLALLVSSGLALVGTASGVILHFT